MGMEDGHKSVAELLGDWRAAERDAVHARSTHEAAGVAVNAASSAAKAASEAEDAAVATMEAAIRAQESAVKAKASSTQVADSARLMSTSTAADLARAEAEVVKAVQAEQDAQWRYKSGFEAGLAKAGDK